MLDDCTDLFISHFLKKKSDLPEQLLATLQRVEAHTGKKTKYIRCDNAPENMEAEKLCFKEGKI